MLPLWFVVNLVNGQVSSEFRLNISGFKDTFFSETRLLF